VEPASDQNKNYQRLVPTGSRTGPCVYGHMYRPVRAKWQKKSGKCPYWPVKYGDLYGHVQGPQISSANNFSSLYLGTFTLR